MLVLAAARVYNWRVWAAELSKLEAELNLAATFPQKMLDELVRAQLAYHCAMIEQLEGAARKVAAIDPDGGADVRAERCSRVCMQGRTWVGDD